MQDAPAPLDVERDHFDATTGRWVSYTVGGPDFLQTYDLMHYGDVVRVSVRVR